MDKQFPRIGCTVWIFTLAAIAATFFHDSSITKIFDGPVERDLIWIAFKERFFKHSLAIIFGIMAGAFFTSWARDIRKWAAFIAFLASGCAAIWVDVRSGDVTFFTTAFFSTYVMIEALTPPTLRSPRKAQTTFGSATWATLEHLQSHKALTNEGGFFLGFFTAPEKSYPIFYNKDRHLLTVAPTRSGKGVSAIVPNLLLYTGSAIVIDPKGENALITSYRRGAGNQELGIEGLGQEVYVVDPWEITGLPVSKFNPLDWLINEEIDESENATMLAEAIVPSSQPSSRDQFWDDEARSLLKGLLLWVAQGEGEDEGLEPEAIPPILETEDDEDAAFAAMMAEEQEAARLAKMRTLGRVRDIISDGKPGQDAVFQAMLHSQNMIIRSAAARTLSKEEKLRGSVMATLQAHTDFLDSPRIRENLSESDFYFEDLKTERMTIYLVLPADRLNTFSRWLRLLIQQAITINSRNIDEKPDKPILFMLDEMAALGHLSMVEQAYSLMAGFGMQLWGIVQDLSQLHKIYGEGWQTFIGNCGAIQYFGSRDLKTTEYFSKMIGVTTIEKRSFSRSIARVFSRSGGSSSETNSTSDDVVQRHLANPDELMVMESNKQIIFIENCNPIIGKKLPWYEMPSVKVYGVDLHKNPNNR